MGLAGQRRWPADGMMLLAHDAGSGVQTRRAALIGTAAKPRDRPCAVGCAPFYKERAGGVHAA